MEVKPGYKWMEAGVIPVDWNFVPLHLLTTEIGDGIHATPVYSSSGDYHFINGNNLREGRIIITKETKAVDYSEFTKYRKDLSDKSILMSINGTIGDLGLFAGEAVILGKSAAYLNVNRNVSKIFIYYSLQTEQVKHQFFDGLTGSTIKNLGLETIRNTQILLPPTLAEQEAIAEALSDADALIASLEQLIAKKRQVKQGAMQELLTGKKRLPGFSGKWEVKKLGNILKLRYGKSQHGIRAEAGAYPILATSGEIGRTNSYLYDKPSVIIGRKGTIDFPQYVETPFWAIDTTYYSEIIDSTIPKFLFYYLYTLNWYSYNEASGVPSLSATTVEEIEVILPSVPEQLIIATILSDMDAEIAALEGKLAKARQVKQGMMQELLTGRIRLI